MQNNSKNRLSMIGSLFCVLESAFVDISMDW